MTLLRYFAGWLASHSELRSRRAALNRYAAAAPVPGLHALPGLAGSRRPPTAVDEVLAGASAAEANVYSVI
jgi:hypothetical protein